MKRSACIWIVGALLLSTPLGWAQDSGPSTGRLISITARDRPLAEVLKEVSAQCGIQHRIASDYEDRAITIRVNALPADALRSAIADLYSDRWVRQMEKGKEAHVLSASEVRRTRQKRLLGAYRTLLRDELLKEAARASREGMPAPPGLSPEQLEEHRQFSEELKARGAVLSKFSAQQIEHFIDGESMRVRLTNAPAPISKEIWSFVERFAMPDTNEGDWTAQDRANAWVHFSSEPYFSGRSDTRDGQDPFRGLPLHDLHMTVGGKTGPTSSYNLAVNPSVFYKRLESTVEDLTRSDEQASADRRRNAGEVLRRTMPKPFPSEERLYGRSELYIELAHAMNLQLVADSHTKKTVPYPFVEGLTLDEALGLLISADASRWRATAGVFGVRSRTWWIDDPSEPPASKMASWRKTLDAKGYLTPADASEMASLTAAQLDRLCMRIPEADIARSIWLRFYAALKPAERRAAAAPKGTPLWLIPEETRHVLVHGGSREALLGHEAFEENVLGAAVRLRVTEEPPVIGGEGVTKPPALYFEMQPVPDVTGRTRGIGVKMRVRMPHRRTNAPSGIGKDGLGRGGLAGGEQKP